jgi:hypothetical protein
MMGIARICQTQPLHPSTGSVQTQALAVLSEQKRLKNHIDKRVSNLYKQKSRRLSSAAF